MEFTVTYTQIGFYLALSLIAMIIGYKVGFKEGNAWPWEDEFDAKFSYGMFLGFMSLIFWPIITPILLLKKILKWTHKKRRIEMNLIHGKERRRINFLIRTLKHQESKFGSDEAREARITDLEKELKKKK